MSPLGELLTLLSVKNAQARMGGMPRAPRSFAGGGRQRGGLGSLAQANSRLVRGPGGGQDDIVPAMLAPGEYVWDADTVAAVGDGSNEEGARRLDALRQRIRAQKRAAPATKIPPKAKAPQHYLRGAR